MPTRNVSPLFAVIVIRCSQCSRTLSTATYATMDGRIYCQPHFAQLVKERLDEGEGRADAAAGAAPKRLSVVFPVSPGEVVVTSTSPGHVGSHTRGMYGDARRGSTAAQELAVLCPPRTARRPSCTTELSPGGTFRNMMAGSRSVVVPSFMSPSPGADRRTSSASIKGWGGGGGGGGGGARPPRNVSYTDTVGMQRRVSQLSLMSTGSGASCGANDTFSGFGFASNDSSFSEGPIGQVKRMSSFNIDVSEVGEVGGVQPSGFGAGRGRRRASPEVGSVSPGYAREKGR